MKNSIIVENLSKNYSENKAVNNINFKIGENEIVGLLGPNGCGKTTTIAMILGLLKPSSGKILVDGIDMENNRIFHYFFDALLSLSFIDCPKPTFLIFSTAIDL